MTAWGRGCNAHHGRPVVSATVPIGAPAFDRHANAAPRTGPDDEARRRPKEVHPRATRSEWRAQGRNCHCIQIVVNRGKAKGSSGGRGTGNSECRAKGPAVKLIGSDETSFFRELHQFVLRACHSLRISVQRNNKSVTSVWIGLFILRFNATRIYEKDI